MHTSTPVSSSTSHTKRILNKTSMPPQPLKVSLAHLVLKLKELQFLTSEIRFDILKPDFRLQVLDILRTGLESSDGVLALGLGGGLGVLVALVAVAVVFESASLYRGGFF